jgi:putative phosphoribosyl transferase
MEPLPPLWSDRHQAGEQLARRFPDLAGRPHTLVLGLPRGGVVVAAALARQLRLPLASWAVRKLADPAWPEVALGAVAPGGVVLWAEGEQGWNPPPAPRSPQRQRWLQEQQGELRRRQGCYGDPDPRSLAGLHLVVVDDGVATGLTARAALVSLRRLGPASLILAVPVMDAQLVEEFAALVDRLEVLAVVPRLEAVGLWYASFPQIDDAEVIALLRAGRAVGLT